MKTTLREAYFVKRLLLGRASRTILLLTMVTCALTGCVRRSLTIRTDPPGASVYMNDQLKGESPVTYDFEWYGWHRLMIRKDGYARLDDRRKLRAPIYLWIPFDLAMELWPWTVYDRREWAYTLTPATPQPTPMPPPLTAAPPAPAISTPATTEPSDAAR